MKVNNANRLIDFLFLRELADLLHHNLDTNAIDIKTHKNKTST